MGPDRADRPRLAADRPGRPRAPCCKSRFWNRILIVLVVLAGLSFAMPNLFYERVERHNDAAAEIEATGVTSEQNAAALAGWPEFLPSTLVNLGLDLRGGAHLLAEVAGRGRL
jgi:preprotein translocase subunit SecD